MFAGILGFIGKAFGAMGSNMCAYFFLEETECPKSLIK